MYRRITGLNRTRILMDRSSSCSTVFTNSWHLQRWGGKGKREETGDERGGVAPPNKRARSASVLYLGPWMYSRGKVRDFVLATGLDDWVLVS